MKYPKRSQYKHAKQKKYHVRNWAEYNKGLRRRGDLTVWFDEEAIADWKADKTGKPGGQRVYVGQLRPKCLVEKSAPRGVSRGARTGFPAGGSESPAKVFSEPYGETTRAESI